jgi:hypothetical protein
VSDVYSYPANSPDEEKPLSASVIREKWDRSLRHSRFEREQAAVNGMFLRNRHWIYWNRSSGRLEELPREPSRVRATVPRVGPDSRRIIAKLMRRNLVFDVPPTSPDDAAMRAARIGESALVEAQRKQSWEDARHEHANCVWEAGVAGLCVEWDWRVGTPIGMDEQGRPIGTGDVKLSVVSIHEIGCEPGTRDLEHARWWIRGVALPPPEVKDLYGLPKEPKADARAIDTIWRVTDSEQWTNVPLTMVLTYYERPTGMRQGVVATVVDGEVVDGGPWPFPFDDRLNISVAHVEKIHGKWYGHTPVSDAVGVQALYNASWSSIVEHMKLAGNARLWVPMGSVDDIEDLSDLPGEAVEYNPINGLSPEYKAPPTMPDWWIRQPAMLESAMDDILGVHDVSRGEAPTGVESGIALSILSENDDTPVGALARSLGECWGRACTMVLKLWEANVQETRDATVYSGGNIPEAVRWSGKDLMGQTTVVVPLDSVIPRSRAAQAAYAMQLYDRKIIQTPVELARVADLPDQDDLLSGIDPDTARAQRENYWLAIGSPRTIDIIDDHQNHLKIHRDFMRSERYENLPEEVQVLIRQHCQAHEMYAAQAAAEQVQAMGVSPLAAMLPTTGTKPLPTENLGQAMAAGTMVPQSAMSPAGPASPGQMLGADGSLPPEIESEIDQITQGGPPATTGPLPGGAPQPPPPGGAYGEGEGPP